MNSLERLFTGDGQEGRALGLANMGDPPPPTRRRRLRFEDGHTKDLRAEGQVIGYLLLANGRPRTAGQISHDLGLTTDETRYALARISRYSAVYQDGETGTRRLFGMDPEAAALFWRRSVVAYDGAMEVKE